jgi:hypothetical protein
MKRKIVVLLSLCLLQSVPIVAASNSGKGVYGGRGLPFMSPVLQQPMDPMMQALSESVFSRSPEKKQAATDRFLKLMYEVAGGRREKKPEASALSEPEFGLQDQLSQYEY